jgi:hypothetical protein
MRSAPSEPVQVQERRGPDGRRMIEIMIEDKMRQTVASGGLDGEMRGRYGAQRAIKQV